MADEHTSPADAPPRVRATVTADCHAAVAFNWPEAHRRCRGNGALRVPAFQAPVLPAQPCGCDCHTQGGAQ